MQNLEDIRNNLVRLNIDDGKLPDPLKFLMDAKGKS